MDLDLKPSSHISSAAYDPHSRELTVRYGSGNAYIFEDVPQATADEFEAADSHGKYHAASLRGQFAGRHA